MMNLEKGLLWERKENQIPGDRRNHLLIRYGTGRMGYLVLRPAARLTSPVQQERGNTQIQHKQMPGSTRNWAASDEHGLGKEQAS